MIEIEIAGPTVENTSNLVKIIARKVTATVAADAAMYLADGHQGILDRLIRILAEPHIVVIAADQKDGVIRSRPDHDRAHQHDGLHVHGQTQFG